MERRMRNEEKKKKTETAVMPLCQRESTSSEERKKTMSKANDPPERSHMEKRAHRRRKAPNRAFDGRGGALTMRHCVALTSTTRDVPPEVCTERTVSALLQRREIAAQMLLMTASSYVNGGALLPVHVYGKDEEESHTHTCFYWCL